MSIQGSLAAIADVVRNPRTSANERIESPVYACSTWATILRMLRITRKSSTTIVDARNVYWKPWKQYQQLTSGVWSLNIRRVNVVAPKSRGIKFHPIDNGQERYPRMTDLWRYRKKMTTKQISLLNTTASIPWQPRRTSRRSASK